MGLALISSLLVKIVGFEFRSVTFYFNARVRIERDLSDNRHTTPIVDYGDLDLGAGVYLTAVRGVFHFEAGAYKGRFFATVPSGVQVASLAASSRSASLDVHDTQDRLPVVRALREPHPENRIPELKISLGILQQLGVPSGNIQIR